MTRAWVRGSVRSTARRLREDMLVRTGALLMATTVATSACGYLYWVLAAHLYAPARIGQVSALIAIVSLGANLAGIGMGATLIGRLPARSTCSGRRALLLAATAVTLCASLCVGLLAAMALPWLAVPLGLQAGPLLAFAVAAGPVLWALAALLDALLLAESRAGAMLARNAVAAAGKIPLMVVPALLGRHGAPALLLSWHLATLLSFAIMLPRVRTVVVARRPTVRAIAREIRGLAPAFGGHHLIGLGGMLWMYLLPVTVGLRRSAADNAYSTLTWLTASILFMISSSIATALFAEGAQRRHELRGRIRQAVRLIALALPPAQIALLLGGRRILALFGAGYERHCWGLLAILALAALPDAVTNLAVAVLRVQCRLAQAACLNLGMATLALALAWLWLPHGGIEAAGWAWLLAQSAGSVGAWRCCARGARARARPRSSAPAASR